MSLYSADILHEIEVVNKFLSYARSAPFFCYAFEFFLIDSAEVGLRHQVKPENFADLIELISHEKISSRGAKDALRKMCATGLDPHAVVKEGGMEQVSDEGELRAAAERVIAANPDAVTDFKKGKENALQFLVGKAMAALKGRGNPGALQRIFRDRLK